MLDADPAEGRPTKPIDRPVTPLPARDVTDLRGMLGLPDGSFVPTLNGVEYTKPLSKAWPKSIPWSPIVGVVRAPDGLEWYVHADGSRSTTQMAYERKSGTWQPMTRVGNPAEAPAGTPADPEPKDG